MWLSDRGRKPARSKPGKSMTSAAAVLHIRLAARHMLDVACTGIYWMRFFELARTARRCDVTCQQGGIVQPRVLRNAPMISGMQAVLPGDGIRFTVRCEPAYGAPLRQKLACQ